MLRRNLTKLFWCGPYQSEIYEKKVNPDEKNPNKCGENVIVAGTEEKVKKAKAEAAAAAAAAAGKPIPPSQTATATSNFKPPVYKLPGPSHASASISAYVDSLSQDNDFLHQQQKNERYRKIAEAKSMYKKPQQQQQQDQQQKQTKMIE